MKEIEVKAYLKDKNKILNSLAELGVQLSEPIVQDGTEYVKEIGSPEIYNSNEYFLRVRTENGIHKFTIKKSPEGIELVSIEYETKIEDRDSFEKALVMMGYKPAMRIQKVRQKGKYKNYEICIDEVVDLGSFIEVEDMSDRDTPIVLAELQEFLFSLGVSPEDEVKKGYDTLILEKQYSK